MKRRNLFSSLLLVSALFGVLFSCSEHVVLTDAPHQNRQSFPLAEIMQAFENDYAAVEQTRADRQLDEDAILDPIEVLPIWDSLMVYDGLTYTQANTQFGSPYGYRVARITQSGDTVLSPLPSMIAFHKEHDTEKTVSWLMFFLPDEETLPSEPFSGLVVNATLAGVPVAVGRYYCGALTAACYLTEDGESRRAACDAANGMLGDIYVARVVGVAQTRGVNDNNLIEEVVIVGSPIVLQPTVEYDSPLIPPFESINWNPSEDIGMNTSQVGGGGGSDSQASDDTYRNNRNIKADDHFRKMLDSIFKDCMGQMLINGINKSVQINDVPNSSGTYTTPSERDAAGNVVGYTITMGGKNRDQLVLIEELMHVYQGAGSNEYATHSLNAELEAKMTFYIYADKTKYKYRVDHYIGPENDFNFDMMYAYLKDKNIDYPFYEQAYIDAIGIFVERSRVYSDASRYVYDSSMKDFPNLSEFIENCLTNKK